MTRLLNTPIIGPSAKTVASSWIDMLAGLSGLYIFKMPPRFWAHAASAANIATNNETAAANPRRLRFISVYLPQLSRGRPPHGDSEPQRNPRSYPAMLGPFAGLSWRVPTPQRIPTHLLHDQRVPRSGTIDINWALQARSDAARPLSP